MLTAHSAGQVVNNLNFLHTQQIQTEITKETPCRTLQEEIYYIHLLLETTKQEVGLPSSALKFTEI